MKKWNLDLQYFTGSYTVTIIKDNNDNWSAASASPASSLDATDKVTLTVTPASGYELDRIEVVSGGVTIYHDSTNGYYFNMGSASVTLKFYAKKNNLYKIIEDTPVWINGTASRLTRNIRLERHNNGAIVGVSCSGSEVTLDTDTVNRLIDNGVLVKIGPSETYGPKPES